MQSSWTEWKVCPRRGEAVGRARGASQGTAAHHGGSNDVEPLRVDPWERATSGDAGPAGIGAVKYYRRCLCVKQKKHASWRGDPVPGSVGLDYGITG